MNLKAAIPLGTGKGPVLKMYLLIGISFDAPRLRAIETTDGPRWTQRGLRRNQRGSVLPVRSDSRSRGQRNVSQGNGDQAMSFIPLTSIPLTSAPAAPLWLRLRSAGFPAGQFFAKKTKLCMIVVPIRSSYEKTGEHPEGERCFREKSGRICVHLWFPFA